MLKHDIRQATGFIIKEGRAQKQTTITHKLKQNTRFQQNIIEHVIVHDGHFCTGLNVLKKGYRSRMILWLACGTCGDLGKYLTVASIS